MILKEILQRKEERMKRLMHALERAVSQLKAMGALKIILFGSLARNDVDIHSDLDLLVIMPSDRTGKEWSRLVYEDVQLDVAHDLIVYNREEFEDMLQKSSFLANVLEHGRVLYEKTV